MTAGQFIDLQFPRKLQFLFEPFDYKVLYGGRGGIKSWSIAQALICIAYDRPTRILCLRELQKSIEESVHELLSLQIKRLGLEWFFKIEKQGITGQWVTDANGERRRSEIVFSGLRDTQNLKSYENFDIFFLEEAANVTKRSWGIIMPTLRKAGSELWIAFNPELTTDPTYEMWVLHPPPGTKAVMTSYLDNPWLTDKLHRQIEHMRRTDPDGFLNVYGGHCRTSLEGAVYATDLRLLTARGGIRNVPYDPALPVHTYWDLGFADQTAIWFVQSAGFEHRVIDFYRNRGVGLPHYIAELQKRSYVYGTHYMPHDARAHQLGTGKSVEELAKAAGLKVKIVPNIGLKNGLNAVRTVLPVTFFDEEKTHDGLDAVRRYRFKVDPETKQFSKEPMHEDHSNPADALRMFAVAVTVPLKPAPPEQPRGQGRAAHSPWS